VVKETDCGEIRIQTMGFALTREGSTAAPVLEATVGGSSLCGEE
jgi:hypothetical protein